VPPSPPSREAILLALRRILEEGWFERADHFRYRARTRELSDHLVFQVIERGAVVDGPTWDEKFGNWRVRIFGTTVDDEELTVGLAVDLVEERIYLITVF
jgi:hypothetical protein